MSDFSMGDKLKVTLFGQSHGPSIGCVLEGFPAGQAVDWDQVRAFMARRAPGQGPWATPRKEGDEFQLLSGLNADGVPCGAPIAAVIYNNNTRSQDYEAFKATPRPGHADYTALVKYGRDWDSRGGGCFSARLTAPLCFAGALCIQWLKAQYGIDIAAHIARIGDVEDALPDTVHPQLPLYEAGAFPVIDPAKGDAMRREIEAARQAGDSLGGQVRCIAAGVPAGLGGPYFGGLEGKLAQALFAIPAAKGIQFGDIKARGSENNDSFSAEEGKISTRTNHCGGILGGITDGMPLHFTLSLKPTPSIALPQQTVRLSDSAPVEMAIQGRHDPCVAPRAVPVVEAVTALVLADLI